MKNSRIFQWLIWVLISSNTKILSVKQERLDALLSFPWRNWRVAALSRLQTLVKLIFGYAFAAPGCQGNAFPPGSFVVRVNQRLAALWIFTCHPGHCGSHGGHDSGRLSICLYVAMPPPSILGGLGRCAVHKNSLRPVDPYSQGG